MNTRERLGEKWLRDHVGHADDSCLIWPFGRRQNGYGYLRFGGVRKSHMAHRVMCELVYGAPPFEKAVVSHLCGKGNLGCVNPRHLGWATQKANIAMKIEHGTSQIGERNGFAKITEEQARMIKSSGKPGVTIARELGISPCTVSAIRVGRNWSWLQEAV